MRLYVRHIWRAFPELDRFSDEQCRRFTRAARRSRPLWLRLAHWLTQWAAWCACAAAGVLLAGLLEKLTWRPDAPLMATYVWIAVSGGAVLLMAVVGVLAWIGLSHLFLRRRITWVLRARGRCASCGYVLVGLPVDRDLRVVCPECGLEATVDRSLGELSVGADGQERYTPSEEVIKRSAPWLTWERVRRWLKWGAYAVGAVGLAAAVVWGVNDVRLSRQAARAARLPTAAQQLTELLKRVEGVPADGETAPTTLELIQALRAKMLKVSAAEFTEGWPAEAPDGYYVAYRGEVSEWFAESLAKNGPNSLRMFNAMERSGIFDDIAAIGRSRVSGVTFSQPTGEPLGSVVGLPDSDLYTMAQWCAARMRVAWDAHDPAKYEAGLTALLGLVAQCERQLSRPMRRRGLGLEDLAYDEAMWVLDRHPGREWLDAVDRALAVYPLGRLESLPIEADKACAEDMLKWLFSEPSRVRWGIWNPAVRKGLEGRGVSLRRIGTLEENLAALESEYSAVIAAAQAQSLALPQGRGSVDGGLVADGYGSTSEILLRYQAYASIRRTGMRIVCAIERFQHERGRLPKTLDELVPSYLKSVPLDVCTGRPLLYKLVDPASDPRKRSYLLYSTGIDGVDNGGNNGGSNAFTPAYAPGVDAVVNERR